MRLAGLTALLALLALAMSANVYGKETIGAKVDLTPTLAWPDGDGDGFRLVHAPGIPAEYQASGGLKADAPGIVTKVRVHAANVFLSPRLMVRVLRAPSFGTSYHVGGLTPDFAPQAGLAEYPMRFPIRAGEELGIDITEGLSGQSVAMAFSPPAAATNSTYTGFPSLGPALPDTNASYDGGALAVTLYNADVEPDADGDGFGDETQDGCPSLASTQAACPPSAPAPRSCNVLKGKARKRCLCRKKPKQARKKCFKRIKAKARKS